MIAFLTKGLRTDAAIAEDAASHSMMEILEEIRIATDQMRRPSRDIIFERMCEFAKLYISREQRHLRRSISTETPIGDAEGDVLTLGGLATSRRYTPGNMEDYADASKIARAAKGLNQWEWQIFLGLADGITAEQAASELRTTAAEIRKERFRVIACIMKARKDFSDDAQI